MFSDFISGMFDDIGSKIKTFVKVAFWVNVALTLLAFVIGEIWLIGAGGSDNTILAIVMIFYVPANLFFAWVGSCFLYGFGELVENSTHGNLQRGRIHEKLKNIEKAVSENKENT